MKKWNNFKRYIICFFLLMIFAVKVPAKDEKSTQIFEMENRNTVTLDVDYTDDMTISYEMLLPAVKNMLSQYENIESEKTRKVNKIVKVHLNHTPQEYDFNINKTVVSDNIDKLMIDTGTIFFNIEPQKLDFQNGSIRIHIVDSNNITKRLSQEGRTANYKKTALCVSFILIALLILSITFFAIIKLKLKEKYMTAMGIGAILIAIFSAGLGVFTSTLDESEFLSNTKEVFLLGEDETPTFSVSFSNTLNMRVGIPIYNNDLDRDYCSIFCDDENIGGKYLVEQNAVETRIRHSGKYCIKEIKKEFNDLGNEDEETIKAINVLAAKNIINGKTNDKFAPNDNITRAEMVTILDKMLALSDDNTTCNFDDVDREAWFYSYIAIAQENHLLSGYKNNTFQPQNNITNAETNAIIANILVNEAGYSYPENPQEYIKKYNDSIPKWAENYIALTEREGINIERENFCPETAITRAEVAIMIFRLYDII